MQAVSVSIVHNYRSEWLHLSDAAQALGCSLSTLYRLRDSDRLKAGIHWLRCSPGRRGRVMVNLPAARLLLQVHTAEQRDGTVR